jgi:hypothetical protein
MDKAPVYLETLFEAMQEVDLDPVRDFVEKYSGRGMMGRECIGIVAPVQKVMQLMVHYAVTLTRNDFDIRDVTEMVDRMQSDSYGKSDTIWYFPGTEVYVDEDLASAYELRG